MKYIEMVMLEKLIRKYINDEERKDFSFKLNDKIISHMAIVVNQSLEGGEDLEDIVRKQVLKEAMDFIDQQTSDPKKLKEDTRELIRNLI